MMKKITASDRQSPEISGSQLQLKTATNAIVPLQFPQENMIDDREYLALQAERINQLAAELEAMILELKTVATKLNSQRYYSLGQEQPDQRVCEYLTVSVPWVKQKPNQTFVLTTRKVDLFSAEREASLLAQQLRQQTRSKTPATNKPRRRQNIVEDNTNGFFPPTLVNKS